MSKLATYERFFIGKIALGLENSRDSICQEDIQSLLSESLHGEKDFVQRIKNALSNIYSKELSDFKAGSLSKDPEKTWEEDVIKLYKGRETLLRDIVIEWYSNYRKPGFWDWVKELFKK
jgi:hypothetical protein